MQIEKTFSNDLVVKRKRLRNKNNKSIKKSEFEIVGKVDSFYDYTALHDYIYVQPTHDISVEKLESMFNNYFIVRICYL
jgi:hypothetical protein